MSYQTGTINSATPAAAAMGILDAALEAHPAWEFIEQVVSGAATARVYRNIALVSGLPNDFYVVISRDTDAGNMRFSICETWDAVGKLLVRYAPAQSGTAGAGSYQVIQADGSVGPTGQAFPSANVLLAQPIDPMLVSTAFPYYLSITNHRICYAHRNVGWVYAGAYESLPNYYDPYPIVLMTNGFAGNMIGYHNGADTLFQWRRQSGYGATQAGGPAATVSAALDYWCGSFTRQWRTTTQAATGWAIRPYLISQIVPTKGSGGLPFWNTREPLSGRWYPGRVGLNQAHASLGVENWDVRGVLRDVFAIDPLDNYPANGDSMIVEGVDTVCMCRSVQTQAGEHFWVSKAA